MHQLNYVQGGGFFFCVEPQLKRRNVIVRYVKRIALASKKKNKITSTRCNKTILVQFSPQIGWGKK